MSLSNIKVQKAELASKIEANMAKHKQEFERAHAAWIQQFLGGAEGFLSEVLDGRHGVPGLLLKFIRDNEEPSYHLSEYEAALEMLSMSTDDHVVISSHEFRELARDEWGWKEHFIANSSKYR